MLTRFPIGAAIIVFGAFSPALIGFFGGWLTELTTGEPCHEGNCAWMVLPWLTLFSLPIGGLVFAIYSIVILFDVVLLMRD